MEAIGDQRAIYGEDGAAATRKVTEGPEMDAEPGPDASPVA
ncbi:hypothetical protein ACQI4F_19875 [Mycolicibacterium vaccae]